MKDDNKSIPFLGRAVVSEYNSIVANIVIFMDFTKPNSPNIGAAIPGRSAATCLSYHESGKRLFVASSGDARLQIIDCLNGKAEQPALKCEREQIHVVEATYVLLYLKRSVCRRSIFIAPSPRFGYCDTHKLIRDFALRDSIPTQTPRQ